MAEDLTEEEVSLVEKFRRRAEEFRDAWQSLMQLEPVASEVPELEEEYQDIYSEGMRIKNTVEWISEKVDAVVGWFGGLWGANLGSTQLGAVQLLPVAAITAAVAYMGHWVARVYMFERTVNEYKEMKEEQGHDAAAEFFGEHGYQAGGGNTLVDAVRDVAKPVGFALAGWGLWRFVVLPALAERRS